MNVNFVREKYQGADKPLTIIPIEAHWSRRTKSNGFCRDTWFKLLKRVKDDPHCRVIFVGDLIDADRPSTRERRMLMGLGRGEVLEEDSLNHMDEMKNHLIKELKPIKDKIIGMVDGDHFKVYENGMTSTKYICNKLGIPTAYLGERMGWVRLTIFRAMGPKSKRRESNAFNFDIFVRHGKGAAGNFGSDVNKLVSQSVGFDANLYVGGHTHRQWFVKVPYIYCAKADIRQRFVGYARAGSLLRGFLYGQSTYAEACEYNPLSIGWPEIFLYIHRHNVDNCVGSLEVKDMKGLT